MAKVGESMDREVHRQCPSSRFCVLHLRPQCSSSCYCLLCLRAAVAVVSSLRHRCVACLFRQPLALSYFWHHVIFGSFVILVILVILMQVVVVRCGGERNFDS